MFVTGRGSAWPTGWKRCKESLRRFLGASSAGCPNGGTYDARRLDFLGERRVGCRMEVTAAMPIFRVTKTRNYSVISNTVLTDKRLSWEARGLAAYLFTKPNGWMVKSEHLIKEGTCGRHMMLRMLQELETNGYLVRRTVNGPGGRLVHEQFLYEEPQTDVGSTNVGKPDVGEADPIVNTDPVSTEGSNTELVIPPRKARRHPFPERMALTEERFDRARKLGVAEPDLQWKRFEAHYRANGAMMADWEAAWDKWCLPKDDYSAKQIVGDVPLVNIGPYNPRALGTNPRALGVNPKAGMAQWPPRPQRPPTKREEKQYDAEALQAFKDAIAKLGDKEEGK